MMGWVVVMRQVCGASFGYRGEFHVKRGVIAITRYLRTEQGQFVGTGYTMGYMRRFYLRVYYMFGVKKTL